MAVEGGGGGIGDDSTCFPLAQDFAPNFWTFDIGLSGQVLVTFFCAGTLLSGPASVTFFRVGAFLSPTGTASAVSLLWGLDLDTRGIAYGSLICERTQCVGCDRCKPNGIMMGRMIPARRCAQCAVSNSPTTAGESRKKLLKS